MNTVLGPLYSAVTAVINAVYYGFALPLEQEHEPIIIHAPVHQNRRRYTIGEKLNIIVRAVCATFWVFWE
jgi:hypothetical protein